MLKQLRISPADQLTLRTRRQDPDHPPTQVFERYKINKRFMQQHQRTLLANVHNHYKACSIPQRSITVC